MFGSLRENGPLDMSLGRGAWTTARGGANEVLEAGRAKRGKVCDPACTLRDVQVPRAHRRTEAGAPGPSPRSSTTRGLAKAAQPSGPHCSDNNPHRPGLRWPRVRPQKRKQSPPTFLPPLPPSSTLQRAPWSEESRAPWASRAWPRALECRELTKGTSRLRMSAQWRRGGAVYICLAVV